MRELIPLIDHIPKLIHPQDILKSFPVSKFPGVSRNGKFYDVEFAGVESSSALCAF